MCFYALMATQDNEPTWQTLACINKRVTRRLSPNKNQDEESGGDPNPGNADEQRAEDQRRYVAQRLRDAASWERKISGGRKV
jgi:hypothetical protein